MNLEVNVSPKTAAWLEQQAQTTGTDQAAVAANALEELAELELGRNGFSGEDRLRFFRQWVESRPARPGPPVDASRASIYD